MTTTIPESGTVSDLHSESSDASMQRQTKAQNKNRKTFEVNLENLDEQMAEAKIFLSTLNKNMGVRSGIMYRLANFMFLMVIFGIEYDMNGLFCSMMTYWSYDIFLLRFLLFFFCFSFVAPLVLHYYFLCNGMPSTSGGGTSTWPTRTPISSSGGRGGQRGGQQRRRNEFVGFLRSRIKARNPFGGEIQFYHFIPGVRFYLLLKSDTDMTDVDAIFRINTLSSFTFGFYQIVGILFTFLYGYEVNLFVWANIGSQVVNWLITLLYFATPIAAWMGRAQEARNVSRLYQGLMNEWSARYCQKDAALFDLENDAELAESNMETQVFKERLAQRIAAAFAGKSGTGKLTGKDVTHFGLERMRDLDVKAFIEIMRDQAICTLEMKGSQ